MRGDVRVVTGVPTAGMFASASGSPIIIDDNTGYAYYLDGNVVVQITVPPPVIPASSLSYFRANRSAGTGLYGSGFATIPFDQQTGDAVATVALGVGTITPNAGVWLFNFQMGIQMTAPGFGQIVLFKNGAQVANGTYHPGDGTYVKCHGADVQSANGTDVFTVQAYSSSNFFIIGPGSETYMSGIKLQ